MNRRNFFTRTAGAIAALLGWKHAKAADTAELDAYLRREEGWLRAHEEELLRERVIYVDPRTWNDLIQPEYTSLGAWEADQARDLTREGP